MSDVFRPTPAHDLTGYLRSYIDEMAFGEEAPDVILDRYHTADFEYHNDGVRLDREKLIAHARPIRKNVLTCQVEIHDALVAGDRVAARYTLHTSMRKGGRLTTEIYMFGELAGDGRLRRIVSTSRNLGGDET
jgi:hypothetical protein